jgi:hypothetical protein
MRKSRNLPSSPVDPKELMAVEQEYLTSHRK